MTKQNLLPLHISEDVKDQLDRIETMLKMVLSHDPQNSSDKAARQRKHNSLEHYRSAVIEIMIPGRITHFTGIYHDVIDKGNLPVEPTQMALLGACNKLAAIGALQKVGKGKYLLPPPPPPAKTKILSLLNPAGKF